MKKEIKHLEQLKEISKEMKTQDNRLASYPYFIVYSRRSIPVDAEYSPPTSHAGENGRYIYTHYRLEDIAFASVDELMERAEQSNFFEFENGDHFREGIKEIYIQDIDVLEGVFLTEKAAKNFIENNGHHLDRPYIYGESFSNNEEMRVVCEAIASLTPEIPPHKNGVGY